LSYQLCNSLYLLFKIRAAAMLALLSKADDNDPLAVAICCTRPARLRVTLALKSLTSTMASKYSYMAPNAPQTDIQRLGCQLLLSRLNMAWVDIKLRNLARDLASGQVQRTQSRHSPVNDRRDCLYDDSAPAAVLRLLTN
jgi:hypothetical protein